MSIESLTKLTFLKNDYEIYSERLSNIFTNHEQKTLDRYYKTATAVKKRRTIGMFTYKEDALWNKTPDFNTLSSRAAKFYPSNPITSFFALDRIFSTNDHYTTDDIPSLPDLEATTKKFEKTVESHLTKRRKLNDEEEVYRDFQNFIMNPVTIDTSQYIFIGDHYANEYVAVENSFSFIDSEMFMEDHINFKEFIKIEEEPMVIDHSRLKKIELEVQVPKFENFRSGWAHLIKNELPKGYDSYCKMYLRRRTQLKKMCDACQQKRISDYTASMTNSRDINVKTKKYLKELQMFQKKIEKDEKEVKKKSEKELQEKRKKDVELREAQRQETKISVLLNQTELFSHILLQKVFNQNFDYESMGDKESIERATTAVEKHFQQIGNFDNAMQAIYKSLRSTHSTPPPALSTTIPSIFQEQLKTYQNEGLKWLVTQYDQGINGILADESGLGKTIQSIAFLSYLAEVKDVWGPFLIIAPQGSLHDWCNEFARFCPSLKVLPYWGTQKERATIRKLWNPKILYTRESPFHVVVSSYNFIIFDEKYLHKIKWQYMILDEAQSQKSFTTVRWKSFSNFSCRNRLLLTGTPVQSSVQELWYLLNFIMPTLFESHTEFQDWFVKDIENFTAGQGMLNERQMSRLHSILKPFMIRRIKKDVEQEIAEKIEVDLLCPLSSKQQLFYSKIEYKMSKVADKPLTSSEAALNLMELATQFRIVCNHPDLFYRQEIHTPFTFSALPTPHAQLNYTPIIASYKNPVTYILPRLVYDEFLYLRHDVRSMVDIYASNNIDNGLVTNPTFSFLPLSGLTPSQLTRFAASNVLSIWEENLELREKQESRNFNSQILKLFNLEIEIPISKLNSYLVEHTSLSKFVSLPMNLFLYGYKWMLKHYSILPKVFSRPIEYYCESSNFVISSIQHEMHSPACKSLLLGRSLKRDNNGDGYLTPLYTTFGGSPISIPNFNNLISASGKLEILDNLLSQLKSEGHRCLLYSQMSKMIDILEEYLVTKKYKFIRLDANAKLSDRRDLVDDWQTRPDIFVFLMNSRTSGVINLTAADTVILYDSDLNSVSDQQAVDRAHRLGQTRQVTVYRMYSKGIEERMTKKVLKSSEKKDPVLVQKAWKKTFLLPNL